MTAGVYAIVNAVTGKAYVGSSVNVERRWYGRRRGLDRGISSNRILQEDWSACQGQGFEFQLLEVTTDENDVLLAAEARWIATLRDSRGVYNLREASVGRHGFPMARYGWAWGFLWKGHRRIRGRKAHYFTPRGRQSLCEKVTKAGSYNFEDFNHDSPSNCAECKRLYATLPKPKRRAARRPAEEES